MDVNFVPIAERTAAQLRARAAQLRSMAATATTLDVVDALLRLAQRYEDVALKRHPAAPLNAASRSRLGGLHETRASPNLHERPPMLASYFASREGDRVDVVVACRPLARR
jgi:hypothetical protein